MKQQFNMDEALELVKQGARIDGKDGVLAPLIKQLTEAVLEAEIESHLSTEINNRKNGKSSKTMKSSVGTFDLDVPRDRNSSFEPEIVKNVLYVDLKLLPLFKYKKIAHDMILLIILVLFFLII